MWVIPDRRYTERVPLQVGTGIINRVMENITEKELAHASDVWKQTDRSTILAKQVDHGKLEFD